LEIMASEVGQSVDPGLFAIFEHEVTPRILAAGPEEEIRSVAV
jgi:hypothetical protein